MPSHPTVKPHPRQITPLCPVTPRSNPTQPPPTNPSINPPIAYTLQMISEDRPWGRYTILFTGPDCQVRRIEVAPGKRLSLQSHQFRAEHWFIVSGTGTAQVSDSTFVVKPGDTIDISIGEKHRISADENGTLSFIEVQTGSSFGELDIVRYADDFGRAN